MADVFDYVEKLREATAASRRSYVPGTPEKYIGAEVRGLRILDAEALLYSLDDLLSASPEDDDLLVALMEAHAALAGWSTPGMKASPGPRENAMAKIEEAARIRKAELPAKKIKEYDA